MAPAACLESLLCRARLVPPPDLPPEGGGGPPFPRPLGSPRPGPPWFCAACSSPPTAAGEEVPFSPERGGTYNMVALSPTLVLALQKYSQRIWPKELTF